MTGKAIPGEQMLKNRNTSALVLSGSFVTGVIAGIHRIILTRPLLKNPDDILFFIRIIRIRQRYLSHDQDCAGFGDA